LSLGGSFSLRRKIFKVFAIGLQRFGDSLTPYHHEVEQEQD